MGNCTGKDSTREKSFLEKTKREDIKQWSLNAALPTDAKPPVNEMLKTLTQLDLTKVPKKGLISGKYLGRVMRVYDGDTMTVVLSLDGGSFWAHQIRLYGCDAPEAKGSTKTYAMRAKDEVLHFIGADGAIGKKNGKEMNTWFQSNPVMITVEFMAGPIGKVDKYGRDLARLWIDNNKCDLTTHMINTGLATPYHGGTKDQSQYEDE